jgi:RimJ/RimL family protein N-acetyltransferase
VLARLFKKAKYAILAAKFGSISYLFTEIRRRIYRKETFIGFEKRLDGAGVEIKSKIPYSLHLASAEDMQEMLLNIQTEGKEALFDLIQRKWFYDSGFHNCFIARTLENNEICYLQWTISRQDDNAGSPDFKSSFPWLGEQDMQLEHSYTFKEYRGKKLMPSVMNRLFQMAGEKGYKRVIGYVLSDNIAALRGCETAGFKKCEIVRRTKLPFSTRNEIIPINALANSTVIVRPILEKRLKPEQSP